MKSLLEITFKSKKVFDVDERMKEENLLAYNEKFSLRSSDDAIVERKQEKSF